MTDDPTEAELAALAADTSANSVMVLLLGLWDEAIARGAGPKVFEQLAERMVSVIPDLVDRPQLAPDRAAPAAATRSGQSRPDATRHNVQRGGQGRAAPT